MSAYFSGAQGHLRLEGFMDKFRAVVSVLLMFSAALTGYYLGSGISGYDSGLACAILAVLITGIGCIVYVLDNPRK